MIAKNCWLSSITSAVVLAFSLQSMGQPTAPTKIRVKEGHVDFLAIGRPSAIKIRGNGDGLTGQLTVKDKAVAGQFRFSLDALDTGIHLRDHHLKEKYLQTKQYPNTKFILSPLTLAGSPIKDGFRATSVVFDGKLQLHGETKPVHGEVTIQTNQTIMSADADFKLQINEYSIPVPTYLGITVANEVQVHVHFKTKIDNGRK